MLPRALLPIAAVLVPLVELAVGIAIIARPMAGAIAAAGLLGLYGVLLTSAILRGVGLEDCGCEWGFSPARGVGWRLVARNAALAGAVLLLAVYPAEAPASGFEILNGVAAAAAGVLIWSGISRLAANREKMKAAGHV